MLKNVLYLIIFQLVSCGSHAQNLVRIDKKITNELYSQLPNLEIFELAFILPELCHFVESDSTRLLERKLKNSFDRKLSSEVKFVHQMELEFLLESLSKDSILTETYINASKGLFAADSLIDFEQKGNYNTVFNSYIEYPEQVDTICIVTLISSDNCELLINIARDQVSQYKFNNWLEFGFNEFRYYPGQDNYVASQINNRLIEHILSLDGCGNSSDLVRKSQAMIKEVIESY